MQIEYKAIYLYTQAQNYFHNVTSFAQTFLYKETKNNFVYILHLSTSTLHIIQNKKKKTRILINGSFDVYLVWNDYNVNPINLDIWRKEICNKSPQHQQQEQQAKIWIFN